jgi:hypothetical protein
MAREKQSRYVMARHRPHDAPNAKIQQALSQSGVMSRIRLLPSAASDRIDKRILPFSKPR